MNRSNIIIAAVLAVLTFAAFSPVVNNGFIEEYDDGQYIINNPKVSAGLTRGGLVWSFRSAGYAANWHPLSWISHMTDVQMFGLNPRGHHLVNLLFHILNTVLLFLLLTVMTGGRWRSAAVAALFAVHPLHVESVAWVAERKDVLSTFFWFLTTAAYLRYLKKPHVLRYALMAFCYVLGLLSKPMLVTLPLVLLLLDYWPLGRLKRGSFSWRPFVEKVPLLGFAAVSSVITLISQGRGQGLSNLDLLPLSVRVANAAASYGVYVVKMFFPVRLAVLYPHEGSGLPGWKVAVSAAMLIVVTAAVLRLAGRFPYLVAGWFWYLLTLVPVIGIVQVGTQSVADRFTYVPLIGLFVMVAWGVSDLTARLPRRTEVLATAFVAVLLSLSVLTWHQCRYWKNGITLFARTVEVTSNNAVAHLNLGNALFRSGRREESILHYYEALRIAPDFPAAHGNLGRVLADTGRHREALHHLRRYVTLNPRAGDISFTLMLIKVVEGRLAGGR